MAGEVRRELRRQAEIKAAKQRVAKEKKIQERLIALIEKYNLKIKVWEEDVKELWQKEQRLISEGKKFGVWLIRRRRIRKQKKLEDLKKITPSIKTQ